jgi:hypothetical protein
MDTEVTKASPAVYIIEQQPFDYTPATSYGELVFMHTPRLAPAAPNAPGLWNKSVIHQLRHELVDYIAGFDYIVPTGGPIRMLLVGMILPEKGKRHKMLGWENRTKRYIEYVIEL